MTVIVLIRNVSFQKSKLYIKSLQLRVKRAGLNELTASPLLLKVIFHSEKQLR